jgi:hypothetical protein
MGLPARSFTPPDPPATVTVYAVAGSIWAQGVKVTVPPVQARSPRTNPEEVLTEKLSEVTVEQSIASEKVAPIVLSSPTPMAPAPGTPEPTVGGVVSGAAVAVTVTLSEPLNAPLSVAVSCKVYVPEAVAVNVDVRDPGTENEDPGGPDTTVHRYVSALPSGSVALPESGYATPTEIVLSAPAFAVGARFVVDSVAVTGELAALLLSVTIN